MSRGHIEFVTIPSLQSDAYAFGALSAGLRGRILSRDKHTGAHTAYLVAAPMWCWRSAGHFDTDLEVLVLKGKLKLGDRLLEAGWYAYVPSGEYLQGIESTEGCSLIWMSGSDSGFIESSGHGSGYDPSRALRSIDTQRQPWTQPGAFEGRTTEETIAGVSVKWLREDPTTTAYTLLSRHAPGWSDPRIEAHDTWEELLLLDGDYLMGDTGAILAGSYIFRPSSRPHGPQVTRFGAVWFCRGERRIDFDLQSPSWAAERARRYIDSAIIDPLLAEHKPWGTWM